MISKRLIIRRLALIGVCLTAIATGPAVRAQQAGVRTDITSHHSRVSGFAAWGAADS